MSVDRRLSIPSYYCTCLCPSLLILHVFVLISISNPIPQGSPAFPTLFVNSFSSRKEAGSLAHGTDRLVCFVRLFSLLNHPAFPSSLSALHPNFLRKPSASPCLAPPPLTASDHGTIFSKPGAEREEGWEGKAHSCFSLDPLLS